MKCQNLLDEVSNASVIGKIQSKLPIEIEKKWSEIEYDEKLLEKSSKDRLTRLMKFLAKYREIVVNRAPDMKPSIGKTFTSFVTGVTFTAKAVSGGGRDRQEKFRSSGGVKKLRPCLACDDGATTRTQYCTSWKNVRFGKALL